jgi:hypothetical protein
MAIKTLLLPLTFKYSESERQVTPSQLQERARSVKAQMMQIEGELNALIEQGFTLWAQEKTEDDSYVGLFIILHKPDEESGLMHAVFEHITGAIRNIDKGDTLRAKQILELIDDTSARLALRYAPIPVGSEQHRKETEVIERRAAEREAKKANEVKS